MKHVLTGLVLLISFAAVAQSSVSRLRIGAGDLISVEVFDVPELKQELRVSDTGDAEFLVLGSLHIGGLTIEDAEDLVATQLKQRLLVAHPQVTLLVREYATQGVAVSGEVRKPGIYQVLGPRSLLQVVSEAGGFTEIASPNITLRHADGTESTVLSAKAADVVLRPGDTVFVPRVGIAYIVGDVARAGGYAMHDEGALSIAQLVALGGGLLPTAKGTKATLVRKSGDTRQQISVNLNDILRGRADDLELQPDDILFVPNSILKTAATRLQNITHIMPGARVGAHCNLGDHTFVESGAALGNHVTVKNGVSVWDGVRTEDHVFIGPNVVFTNDRNPRAAIRKSRSQFLTTHICEGASLGANVTVVCGITIGRYAFAGAGAVLTKDVPDHALMIGNPARCAGFVCECGEKLSTELTCACGLTYGRENGRVFRVPF